MTREEFENQALQLLLLAYARTQGLGGLQRANLLEAKLQGSRLPFSQLKGAMLGQRYIR